MSLKPPGDPNASINQLYGLVNAVQNGARGDGVTDNTSIVNGLITTVADAGGGTVVFDAGTFVGNFVIRPKVRLVGVGAATVLKAKAGSNDDVIKGANFASLTGKTKETGDYALGAYEVELADMVIDGNKSANSSGYGVRIWGRAPRTTGVVVIRNCKSGGLWTEFTEVDSFADPTQVLEGSFDTLSIQNCDGHGWTLRGPHDTVVKKCEIWGCTGWAVRVEQTAGGYNGGVYFRHLNFFLCGNGAYVGGTGLFEIHGGAITGETGTGLEFEATTGSGKVRGVVIAGHETGVILRGTSHQIDAQVDRMTATGIEVDGAINCRVNVHGAGTPAAIHVTSESGPNFYNGLFDVPSGGSLLSGAAFNSGTWAMLKGYGAGGTSVTQQSPGAVTFTGVVASTVAINSLFRDQADDKLKFKDAGGTVNNLY